MRTRFSAKAGGIELTSLRRERTRFDDEGRGFD